MRNPEILKERIQKAYVNLVKSEAEGQVKVKYENLEITNTTLELPATKISYKKYDPEILKPCMTDQWAINKKKSIISNIFKKALNIKNRGYTALPPNSQVHIRCHIAYEYQQPKEVIAYKESFHFTPLGAKVAEKRKIKMQVKNHLEQYRYGRLFISNNDNVEFIGQNQEENLNKQVIIKKCSAAIKKLDKIIRENKEYENYKKNKDQLMKTEEEKTRAVESLMRKEKELRKRKDKLHNDIQHTIYRKMSKVRAAYDRLKTAKDNFYNKVDQFREKKNAFYQKQKDTKQQIRDNIKHNLEQHYGTLKMDNMKTTITKMAKELGERHYLVRRLPKQFLNKK